MYRNEDRYRTDTELQDSKLSPQLPHSCLGERCWLSDFAKGKTPAFEFPNNAGCRHYLPGGVYADKLLRLTADFPQEQIMVIQSEYFWKNTAQVLAEVWKFLDIHPLDSGDLPASSCWHDCEIPSAPFKVTEQTHSNLSSFYKKDQTKLLEQMQVLQQTGLSVVPANPLETWTFPGLEIDDAINSEQLLIGAKVIRQGNWYVKEEPKAGLKADNVKAVTADTIRHRDASVTPAPTSVEPVWLELPTKGQQSASAVVTNGEPAVAITQMSAAGPNWDMTTLLSVFLVGVMVGVVARPLVRFAKNKRRVY